ncbi:MAG: hypothetical protein FJ278_25020, partial [Planctomycetes bacterium]|nr:hypothetical protein [Planctomycetota bacterium]
MQGYTADFARRELTAQGEDIAVKQHRYRAEIGQGWVLERGPDGERKHDIRQVMGGKNVYYFLTPMERGRLQVLPVAYDVRTKSWFNTTASHVRQNLERPNEPFDWRERPLTFNTTCYNCHVSRLSSHYDPKTDAYQTIWAEPGINCETCHGPGEAHVQACRSAKAGPPPDLKILRWRDLTIEQRNESCAPCHAKIVPLSATFKPGDRYFDHFDLATLEDSDFYPDGRDLGENFTFTTWRLSPCAKSGKLDCVHCHTASGRYRFTGDQANQSCLPCHEKNVKDAASHSRHKADGDGSKCVACHMPMTEFARMRRSDHSMRPPAPAATLAFKSPNACNL